MNDPAERLRHRMFDAGLEGRWTEWLDEALAAERRAAYEEGIGDSRLIARQVRLATVARIRAAWERHMLQSGEPSSVHNAERRMHGILDEVAAG